MFKTSSIFLALVIGLSNSAIANPVVFEQPSDNSGNLYASQYDSGPSGFGSFAKTYDNFQLSSSTNITDVHWTGGYFTGIKDPANPITQFLIEFWSDSASGPSTLLASEAIAGNASEVFSGTFGGFDIYNYAVDLTTPFLASAGATYWLSIQPTLVFPPQWGQATSAVGDGVSYQEFFGTKGPVAKDLAFSLTGVDAEPVPEPGSLALVGLGLTCLCVRRRSKAT